MKDPEKELQEKVTATLEKHIPKLQSAVDHILKYPQCSLLENTHEARFYITGFLEWLEEEKGFDLASEFEEFQRALGMKRCPFINSNEALVFEYLGIDKKQLEVERQTLIEEQRKANEEKP